MESDHEETGYERLPWHRPELQRLEVTLDTRVGGGSSVDGEIGSLFDFAEG